MIALRHSIVVALTLLPALFAHRLQYSRQLGAGALCSYILFALLPQSAPLCSVVIVLPSFLLGVVLNVFWKESVTPRNASYRNTFALFLFGAALGMVVSGGFLPATALCCFLPVGILLAEEKRRFLYCILIPVFIWLSGIAIPIIDTSRWSGCILAIACGAMVETVAPQVHIAGITLGLFLTIIP